MIHFMGGGVAVGAGLRTHQWLAVKVFRLGRFQTDLQTLQQTEDAVHQHLHRCSSPNHPSAVSPKNNNNKKRKERRSKFF